MHVQPFLAFAVAKPAQKFACFAMQTLNHHHSFVSKWIVFMNAAGFATVCLDFRRQDAWYRGIFEVAED